jgi:glycyl-tRNA synthetase alpha chain
VGWQVLLDGMEITQFTYFQQAGGIDLSPVTAEITYGLERIAMFLSKVDSIYDVMWNSEMSYGQVRRWEEVELSKYGFEVADTELAMRMLEAHEAEARRALAAGLVLPAYEATLVCSHQFNLLDARGAVSASDRVGLVRRIRDLACACARAYVAAREGETRPAVETPATV